MKKKVRISFLEIVITLLFLIISGSLLNHSLSSAKYDKYENINSLRGSIFSSDMNLIAVSLKKYSIYIDPKLIDWNREKEYEELIKNINLSFSFKEKFLNLNKRFVWLVRFGDENIYHTVKAYELPGIGIIKEYLRVYPYENIASNIVGFVGIDGFGLNGIEYSADKYLRNSNITIDEPLTGKDIVLTINMNLQKRVFEIMKDYYNKYRPESISTIVLESDTGNIIAMENFPNFDPNNFKRYNIEIFKNLAISHIDEPGSTFKPLIMAYLIEKNLVNETERLNCKGTEDINGVIIRDMENHGIVNIKDIIVKSCNIGMALFSQRLTKTEIYTILKDYGFGEKTGILLPGEENGILRIPQKMTYASKIAISIGQEIGVTPIQLVKAYTAITNSGIIVKPRIIDRTIYNMDTIEIFPIEKEKKILKTSTTNKILSFMREVVTRGTGKNANIEGVWLAGKTGTAQIFDPKENKYKYTNTSFIGIIKNPKNNKYYIIYSVLRKPVGDYTGGMIAAPLVRDVGIVLLQILK
ncbi:MAG TPA: penicillin-binding protein 2 [Spirochaetota bacterium]|nr:penicillin-binding protein 2 [Spirochaetota bacterium]HOM39038.1 penicillin-binding protein 2 [Spirochaetota bacterium]HPQ49909.1 penicillin-binding protein 2 [Spirochaetota bacterium]